MHILVFFILLKLDLAINSFLAARYLVLATSFLPSFLLFVFFLFKNSIIYPNSQVLKLKKKIIWLGGSSRGLGSRLCRGSGRQLKEVVGDDSGCCEWSSIASGTLAGRKTSDATMSVRLYRLRLSQGLPFSSIFPSFIYFIL